MIVKLSVLIDKFGTSLIIIKLPLKNIFSNSLLVIAMMIFSSGYLPAQEHKIIKAKSGDNIYSVFRENNIPYSYFNEFTLLNKSKLGKDNQLFAGVSYQLPLVESTTTNDQPGSADQKSQVSSSTRTVKYDIFGSKYENIEIKSDELKGATYYLVAGHGGPDPGAVAHYNGKTLCEDEYAYDITLRLARELISYGAIVYLITRDNNDGIRDGWYLKPDKDERCYPNLTIPINQNARLKQRKDAVNELYLQYRGTYQRLVVIHVDSRSKGQKIDVFFYHDKRSAQGKKLATNLRNTFDSKYNKHQPGRGYNGSVSERNLYMLKYSWPVATFIELGNINHERDLKRFIMDDNRQAVANWLAEGLQIDFKNNK
ncbi:MAG: N-acetylmuramoyl-L-alanine amidase [Prolixibacteraceae bacterium]